MNYAEQIQQFIPLNKQEENDQKVILKCIAEYGDSVLTRENKHAHITSSSMIFNRKRDQVLMIYHNLYCSWAWTGGHADEDGNLLRVAIREAVEETGVKNIQPLQSALISLEILPVWGHMKRDEYISSHLHLNITYALIADEHEELVVKQDENSAVAWLPINNLKTYVSEPAMMSVYEKVIDRARIWFC